MYTSADIVVFVESTRCKNRLLRPLRCNMSNAKMQKSKKSSLAPECAVKVFVEHMTSVLYRDLYGNKTYL